MRVGVLAAFQEATEVGGINGIKITLQVVDLATNVCLDFGATRLLLLGNSEEVGMSFTAVTTWLVYSSI